MQRLGGVGVLHVVAEVFEEVDAELGDADVHFGPELLTDAGVGVGG